MAPQNIQGTILTLLLHVSNFMEKSIGLQRVNPLYVHGFFHAIRYNKLWMVHFINGSQGRITKSRCISVTVLPNSVDSDETLHSSGTPQFAYGSTVAQW